MKGGKLTASRRTAVEKLLRFGEVRQGMGQWDLDAPVVSPAAASWLVDEQLAHEAGGTLTLEDGARCRQLLAGATS